MNKAKLMAAIVERGSSVEKLSKTIGINKSTFYKKMEKDNHADFYRRELIAIQRELREETGYTADEWIPLGDFHPAPAYSDEYISMYMARKLHPGKRHLDEDEFLDVFTVPLSELVEDVMAGRISDAKTQTAVLKAARMLGI